MTPNTIKLALLIAILVTILSKLFWISVILGIGWIIWILFKNSNTYKMYSK